MDRRANDIGREGKTTDAEVRILNRRLVDNQSVLRLSDGTSISLRRYIPAGQGDQLRLRDSTVEVFAKHDTSWIQIDPSWSWTTSVKVGPENVTLIFKEIEDREELDRFDSLRRFHYRGAGGAGRTVPIIARTDLWDLPEVAGFIEISSSMIANTARKRFFDHPFFESAEVSWQQWDTKAGKQLSNTISRISRFVIHPELRGLGLARPFLEAAKRFSAERWHFGGRRPRFIEITADMLRYYRFVGPDFAFMGETEGNEHRLVKDMTYLVKRALVEGQGMPQGGGGIMTLQRGYASRLLRYLSRTERSLGEVVRSLQHNPALLDQETWEALHRLNRKPKLTFVAGITPQASTYVQLRRTRLQKDLRAAVPAVAGRTWSISNLGLRAEARIAQTSEARTLQDAFGFVGADVTTDLIEGLSFEIRSGEITLVCGASGSGKSLFLQACASLLDGKGHQIEGSGLNISGSISRSARVATLPHLSLSKTPLELKGRVSLDAFLQVAAKCGLAEPQLFVRPIGSLSSGQRYRLSVALSFLEDPDIVIIDNFCEPLDRYTAVGVLRGLKRLAAERGVAVIGATAAYDRNYLLAAADQSIMLRRGERALVRREGVDDVQKGIHDQSLPVEESK